MIPRCPRTSGALETANSMNECVSPREVLKRRNRRSASNEKPAQAVTVAQSASTVYHDLRAKPIRHRRYFLDPCDDGSEPSGHAVRRRLRAEPVAGCASATPRQKTRHILPPAAGGNDKRGKPAKPLRRERLPARSGPVRSAAAACLDAARPAGHHRINIPPLTSTVAPVM